MGRLLIFFPDFLLKMDEVIGIDRYPDKRITPMAPTPVGVARAIMVSLFNIFAKILIKNCCSICISFFY